MLALQTAGKQKDSRLRKSSQLWEKLYCCYLRQLEVLDSNLVWSRQARVAVGELGLPNYKRFH